VGIDWVHRRCVDAQWDDPSRGKVDDRILATGIPPSQPGAHRHFEASFNE
jgi:hypothetical protein